MSAPVRQTASDQNLLFGILAWQLDFVDHEALLAGMQAWVIARDRSLGQILCERGALGQAERDLLDALLQKHLEKHGGDPAKSLAALSSADAICRELSCIADPEVQASLAQVPHMRDEAPPTRPPSVGPVDAGSRFRVLRPHAVGGLGQVSVAFDAELHREVAFKEIRGHHADDAHSRQRFLLEAEITGALEHPGIVPVYSLGTYADGRPFYAMRFIKGDSLHDAIKRFHNAGPPPSGEYTFELRKLLARFLDVCNAIAYAHSRGVLHRDLKPGNIMLGEYGETLVVDWGLAKVLGQAADRTASEPALLPPSADSSTPTQMGMAVGTPHFMAPEQAAGRIDLLGPASDVYSLGATLYAVLTGRPPFEGGNTGKVLHDVQQGQFPRPRQLNPAVPPALEAICLRAMALKPQDRYATPRLLADDLERWLADEPVLAWREPWRQRFARWTRRHRTLAVAASVGLVLTVAATVAGLWLWTAAEQRREVQQREYRASLQAEAEADERLALDQIKYGRLASAEQILHRAVQRLDGEETLTELRDRLALRRDRASRLVSFNKQSDFSFSLVMSEQLRLAADASEKAVKAVTSLDEPEWWKHLPDDELTKDQRSQLREDVYRQILMLAGLRGQPGLVRFGSPEAAPTYRAALVTIAPAQRFRPSFVGSLLELMCHVGLGELGQIKMPKMQEPTDAADYFFCGMLHGWLVMMPSDPLSGLLFQQVRLMGLKGLDLKKPLETAERYLREAAKQDPRNYWAHLTLGGVLMTRDPQTAELAFNACLGLRPERIDVFLVRADILSRKAWEGDAKRRKQLMGQALANYDEATVRNPNNAIVYINRAHTEAENGDHDQALADIEKAAALEPNNPLVLYTRGNIHYARGELDRALADCRAALRGDPDNPEAHDICGMALFGKRDAGAALAEFDSSLRLNPWNAVVLVHRAGCLRELKEFDKALADCDRALRLDGELALAWNQRGLIRFARREFSLAVSDHTRAIALAPASVRTYTDRADAYFRLGDIDRMAADCEAALKLDMHHAPAWNLRGLARNQRGDFVNALADFTEAIRLQPKHSYAHSNRALAYFRLGQPEKGLIDCGRALELFRNNEDAFNFRGLIHLRLGQHDKALEDFTEAIRLALNSADALVNRAETHLELNNLDKALADSDRALKLFDKHVWGLFIRGVTYAHKGMVEPSLRDIGRTIELNPKNGQFRHAQAVISLRAGDEKTYQQACLALLEQLEKEWSENHHQWTMRAGLLGRHAPEVARRFLVQAEKRLAANPTKPGPLLVAGIFLYRTDQVEGGIKRLEEAQRAGWPGHKALPLFYLGLAHHARQQKTEAKTYLRQALESMADTKPPPRWFEQVELEIIRREVEAALK